MSKSRLKALRIAMFATTVFTATPAFSQAKGSASATDESAPSGEIVVTGSRLPANGNSSPTPVTVASTEELAQTTPSNIADALNKLPVFTGLPGQRYLSNSSSNSAGNYLNLRALGAARNLILLDGNRFISTTQSGLIDTNTIPQLLIKRVEVVTGGASAVYGSDAVSGVVNFVLDKKFNGIKVSGQAGISNYGDDKSTRLGIAAGTDLFGGRGHFEASYEFYNRDGIRLTTDRPYGARVYGETGAGTVASPFRLTADNRGSVTSFGGLIGSGPLANQHFVAPGILAPFVRGVATGSAGVDSGGDGAYRVRGLMAGLRTHQVFARFAYDLSDDVAFHVQATGTKANNENVHSPFFFQNLTIASDNAFLPSSIQTALGVTPTFLFSRLYGIDSAPNNETFTDIRSGYLNLGLEGKLGSEFKWNLGFSSGEARQKVTSHNNISNTRLRAALDAVRDPSGNIVCRSSLTNPGRFPGCVPLNPFGTTGQAAAISYIMGDTSFTVTNKLTNLFGTVSGHAFDTWAGPVNVAINAEYRKVSFINETTSNPSVPADCTGLRFDCSATTAEYVFPRTAPGAPSQSVSEIAGEISLPLVKDAPLFKSVDLTGAVRYTHYSTAGNATTWKIGLDWSVSDELRFRATRSRDIRAPSLQDLFQPATSSLTGFSDIHTSTSSLVALEARGNPNLKPEVAQTFTAGTVYQPNWLPGFTIAVDYYRIKIRDAISAVGGNSATTQALCEASNGTSPFCTLYVRPLPFSDRTAANYPTLILSSPLNVANLLSEGLDVELNYRTKLGGGELQLRGLASYTAKLEEQQLPGGAISNHAGAATVGTLAGGIAPVPKVRLTAFLNYNLGNFDFNLQERWRSSLKQSGNPTLVYSDPKVPSVAYTDVTLTYQLATVPGKPSIFLSVQNLFNKQPPVVASTEFAALPGFAYPTYIGDDVVGRYFTFGVKAQF